MIDKDTQPLAAVICIIMALVVIALATALIVVSRL